MNEYERTWDEAIDFMKDEIKDAIRQQHRKNYSQIGLKNNQIIDEKERLLTKLELELIGNTYVMQEEWKRHQRLNDDS